MALLYKCIINNAVIGKYNRAINKVIADTNKDGLYEWKDSDGNSHPVDIGAFMFNSYKNGNIGYVLYSYFNLMSITEYILEISTRLKMKGVKI